MPAQGKLYTVSYPTIAAFNAATNATTGNPKIAPPGTLVFDEATGKLYTYPGASAIGVLVGGQT